MRKWRWRGGGLAAWHVRDVQLTSSRTSQTSNAPIRIQKIKGMINDLPLHVTTLQSGLSPAILSGEMFSDIVRSICELCCLSDVPNTLTNTHICWSSAPRDTYNSGVYTSSSPHRPLSLFPCNKYLLLASVTVSEVNIGQTPENNCFIFILICSSEKCCFHERDGLPGRYGFQARISIVCKVTWA